MSNDSILHPRNHSADVRRRFIRKLVLLILLIVGFIGALVWFQGEKTQVSSYRQVIRQKASLADDSIKNFFSRVDSSVTVLRKWGRSGLLDLDDNEAITIKLIPILGDLPNVTAASIADSTGRAYLLTRDSDGWLARFVDPGKKKGMAWFSRWGSDGVLQNEWKKPFDYDPRQRPWYKDALKAGNSGSIAWTPPYSFSSGHMGITASTSWYDEKTPEEIQAVAYDMILDDLYQSVAQIKISEQGKVFLFNTSGQVLESSPNGDNQIVRFVDYQTLDDQVIAQAVSTWRENPAKDSDPVSLNLEKQKWWADSYPVGPSSLSLMLGIITPESDFSAYHQKNIYVFAAIASVMGVGVILIILFTRKYTRDIQKLRHRVINRDSLAEDVLRLIKSGESGSLEFKSTLRQNLKSGKPGKEIELAWLKTVVAYLNTEGGFLLFGVSDEGEILGMGPDLFLNDDHCLRHFKNLIHQHIGIEFAKMIHFDLLEIDGKVIGLVDCNPADEPVFLLNKDGEDFYVRSGPATIKLTSKKMLKYLEDHKRDA